MRSWIAALALVSLTGCASSDDSEALPKGATLEAVSYSVDPADPTRIEVAAREGQCTGGRDPEAYLQEPRVIEDEFSVAVYLTSKPYVGDADCQGNPTTTISIELDAPIGDREVLDLSHSPAAPVAKQQVQGSSPLAEQDGEALVACLGRAPGWKPSILPDGVPDVLSDAEAKQLFQGLLDDPSFGGEADRSLLTEGIDTPWRVLSSSPEQLTLGIGPWAADGPEPGASFLTLTHKDGRWVHGQWGNCELRALYAPGSTIVEAKSFALDPTDLRALTVNVSELECSGGRDPRPYLQDPYIVETPETVTLYLAVEPAEGARTCVGGPPVPITVHLAEPLDERVLLDGSVYPPAPVALR